jgi:hypothetical protein
MWSSVSNVVYEPLIVKAIIYSLYSRPYSSAREKSEGKWLRKPKQQVTIAKNRNPSQKSWELIC